MLERLAQSRLYNAEGDFYQQKTKPQPESEFGFYQGYKDGFHQVLIDGQIVSGHLESTGSLGINSRVMVQRAAGGTTLFYAMPS